MPRARSNRRRPLRQRAAARHTAPAVPAGPPDAQSVRRKADEPALPADTPKRPCHARSHSPAIHDGTAHQPGRPSTAVCSSTTRRHSLKTLAAKQAFDPRTWSPMKIGGGTPALPVRQWHMLRLCGTGGAQWHLIPSPGCDKALDMRLVYEIPAIAQSATLPDPGTADALPGPATSRNAGTGHATPCQSTVAAAITGPRPGESLAGEHPKPLNRDGCPR